MPRPHSNPTKMALMTNPNPLETPMPTTVIPSPWKLIESAPDGVEVWTKIDDGEGIRNVQTLKRLGRLWYFPDGSMYVYYQPTHWMPVSTPTGHE
jgi:hypothetical protein